MQRAFPLPLLAVALASAPLAPQAAGQEPPFVKDQTGIQWVLPFEKAMAMAKERNRLLLVKPIAFGTTRSGNW